MTGVKRRTQKQLDKVSRLLIEVAVMNVVILQTEVLISDLPNMLARIEANIPQLWPLS